MILNTKRIHNSFWGNFPARAKQFNAFKSFICQQEKATTAAVRSLRAKIVIVAGNSKWVKSHHFCAQLSHCFSIYWNNYSPQCRWLVVWIFTSPLTRPRYIPPLATSTSVNNCYIYYRYNIKHLYNIQIQKYIANKKIIENYEQMKHKWPVTAIKPLKTNFLVWPATLAHLYTSCPVWFNFILG